VSEPFLSEIRVFSFNFAPKGWTLCDGQLLPINQNQALFSLLGTTYGGNGTTNFGLPNLQGRVPIHTTNGGAHPLGEMGGTEIETLQVQHLPAHSHNLDARTGGPPTIMPAGAVMGAGDEAAYGPPVGLTTLRPDSIANTGGTQPHLNLQPLLVLNFCIALQGIFPSRS
jgi:microcystin-dependent protein